MTNIQILAKSYKLLDYCQTLISSGYDVLSFTRDVWIIASRIMVFGTGHSAKPGITPGFDQEKKKIQGKGGKRIILGIFLDPSLPRLASGSLGP